MTHHATQIDLEDLAIGVATFSGDVEYQPAEPDVGIFRGYLKSHAMLDGWRIGCLRLSREQLILAMTKETNTPEDRAEAEAELEALEERARRQSEEEVQDAAEAWAAQ